MVWILFGKLRNVICDFSPCVFFGRFIHLFNVLSETKKIWYDKLMSKRSWNQHNVFKYQPVSKQIYPVHSCTCIKFIELPKKLFNKGLDLLLFELWSSDDKLCDVLRSLDLVLIFLYILNHFFQPWVWRRSQTSTFQSL